MSTGIITPDHPVGVQAIGVPYNIPSVNSARSGYTGFISFCWNAFIYHRRAKKFKMTLRYTYEVPFHKVW